jgi:hypothetical protein
MLLIYYWKNWNKSNNFFQGLVQLVTGWFPASILNIPICIEANVCLSVQDYLFNPLTESNQILCSDYSETGEKHKLHKNLTL